MKSASIDISNPDKPKRVAIIASNPSVLQSDKAQMAQIVNASSDKWNMEFLQVQAQTAAYYGRLRQSRELVRRMILTARQSEQEELGGLFEGFAAESEALFGEAELAKKEARRMLASYWKPQTWTRRWRRRARAPKRAVGRSRCARFFLNHQTAAPEQPAAAKELSVTAPANWRCSVASSRPGWQQT